MFIIIPYRSIKMKVPSFGILGIAFILATPASAQTLTAGKWTGTLNLSSGPTIKVEFTVQGEGDAMQIVMNAVDGPPQPVSDLELSDKEMSFTWGAFTCSLERKNDSKYEGDCQGAAAAELTLEAPTQQARDVNMVTGAELEETQQSTVYDALQQLRPQWLRARGGARTRGTIWVTVFIGGQRMGDVGFLRSLAPNTVSEIRFYTASEATMTFGSDNAGGVIAITQRF